MRFAFAAALILLGNFFPAYGEEIDKVSTFSLDNGLEVVVIEYPGARDAVHMVWYRAGAADDPPGKSGIAHLVENLMHRRMANYVSAEMSTTVVENLVEANAFYSYDYIAFLQRIAPEQLGLTMMIEASRMNGLKFNAKEFQEIQLAILDERRRNRESSPDGLFAEQCMAALFLNHPYGIPVKGWRHEIGNLTATDADDFFRRYLAPNNAILLIAGDISPLKVRELAESHFGAIKPSLAIQPRIRPAEPPHLAERRLTFSVGGVQRPYLVRHYLAPERDSGDQESAAALTVLEELLGGESGSILHQRLVNERMVAFFTSAFYGGTAYDDTSFGVFVMPPNGVTLEEAEAALDEEIAVFLAKGPDPDHLERVKDQILADLTNKKRSIRVRALEYGRALTAGLSVEDVQEWPRILEGVTGEDILKAASRVLNKKQSVTGWMTASEIK